MPVLNARTRFALHADNCIDYCNLIPNVGPNLYQPNALIETNVKLAFLKTRMNKSNSDLKRIKIKSNQRKESCVQVPSTSGEHFVTSAGHVLSTPRPHRDAI